MKDRSPAPIILVRGCPGVGKSSSATTLSEILGGCYVDGDAAMNFARKLYGDTPQGKASMMELLESQVREIKKEDPIVLDWVTSTQSSIDSFKKIAQRQKRDLAIFTLHAPLLLCNERCLQRERYISPSEVRKLHRLFGRESEGFHIDTDRISAEEVAQKITQELKLA